jgi:hypothetical protein
MPLTQPDFAGFRIERQIVQSDVAVDQNAIVRAHRRLLVEFDDLFHCANEAVGRPPPSEDVRESDRLSPDNGPAAAGSRRRTTIAPPFQG